MQYTIQDYVDFTNTHLGYDDFEGDTLVKAYVNIADTVRCLATLCQSPCCNARLVQ